MPTYKLLNNLNERYAHNGLLYDPGAEIMGRIVLTEEEAATMNKWQKETLLVKTEDEKIKATRPLAQMNKAELIEEGKKIELDLDEILTKEKMIEAIKTKRELIKNS